MSPQWKRRLRIGSVAVAAVVVVPTIAFALPYIDLPFEATFTGCLKPNGEINKVAQGADPKQPCNDTDQEIHLSGGDILKRCQQRVDLARIVAEQGEYGQHV